MSRLRACLSALFLLMCACPHTSSDQRLAAVERTIREDEVNWAIAWGSQDLDRIVRHYADDAVLMLPGRPAIRGKPAIREVLRRLLAVENAVVTLATSFVAVSPDAEMAYSRGTYSVFTTGTRSTGQYVVVYRKRGKLWLAVEDLRNKE